MTTSPTPAPKAEAGEKPTPRTDGFEIVVSGESPVLGNRYRAWADFCRGLERELRDAQIKLEHWRLFGAFFVPQTIKTPPLEIPDDEFRTHITKSVTSGRDTIHQFVEEVSDLRQQLAAKEREAADVRYMLKHTNAALDEVGQVLREWNPPGANDGSACAWANALGKERNRLRREVEILRSYGNKDCTAMADAVLAGKTP